jgi:uncharacterized protein YegP (UPF0339 family)
MRLFILLIALATAVGGFVVTDLPTANAADDKAAQQSSGTFEVYQDKAGEYRWRLKSTNGQSIATSGEGYSDKRSCLAGIESVKRAAANAKVEEIAEK